MTCGLLISMGLWTGCKKDNGLGVDNDRVIRTPYSLYATNIEGTLVNSTDGTTFNSIFPPDGYAPHLLLTAGPNLLMLKENLHLSENDGRNFNPVYRAVRKFPWQSMAHYAEPHGRIYITSTEGAGVAFSADQGLTWEVDSLLSGSAEISSFASLGNGVVFGYSNALNRLMRKANPDAVWEGVEMQGLLPVDESEFFLTANASTLFLVDRNGMGGVWYSEDEGANFTRISQGSLPEGVTYYAALSNAGGQSMVIGTAAGIFRNLDGSFVTANGGLETGTEVYALSHKENIYKNDAIKPYEFAATSTGIYISEDRGRTWDKVTHGVWDAVYVAIY